MVPVSILMTSYMLGVLGKEEFGVWALVGVISSYAQLSDFGLTESLIKFMAEFRARNDAPRLNSLVNTALTAYLLISAVFCGLFLLALPFIIDRVMQIPPELRAVSSGVFTVAVLVFFLNMTLGVFSSLITGFQEMAYSNMISLFSSLAAAGGSVYALQAGYGLPGLIRVSAAVAVLTGILNFLAARRLFPEMEINPFRHFTSETLRRIFGFSWKVQVSTVTQLMIFQVDRLLLSHYLGLKAVTDYEVANRVAFQAKGFMGTLFTPIAPASSAIHATNSPDLIVGLYRRSFKYVAMLAVPASFLIIGLAHPFVRAWVGPGYGTSALTMQLLMAAYMLNLMTGPGGWILSGINKPQIGMRSSVMAAVINISLCVLLIPSVGYYGMVIAISASIVISGLYFLRLVHRNIEGLTWSLYGDTLTRPILISGALAALLILADRTVGISGFPALFAISAVYCAAIAYGLGRGGYLDETDRATLQKINPARFLKK